MKIQYTASRPALLRDIETLPKAEAMAKAIRAAGFRVGISGQSNPVDNSWIPGYCIRVEGTAKEANIG